MLPGHELHATVMVANKRSCPLSRPAHGQDDAATRLLKVKRISFDELIRLERECLSGLKEYGRSRGSPREDLLDSLVAYDTHVAPPGRSDNQVRNARERIRRTLEDRPWEKCPCDICKRWGIEPDPQVLAFAETYEGQRADLKNVMGSA